MKSLIVFTLTLLIGFSSQAQQYVPMLGNTNEWYEYQIYEFNSATIRTHASRDTIINGLNYKIAESNYAANPFFYPYVGLLREDTAERKIHFTYLLYSSVFDTVNKILYDFSKGVGDTVEVHTLNSDQVTVRALVDSIAIDTAISLNRVFYLHVLDGAHNYQMQWIEGVGSRGGLFSRYWSSNPGARANILLCAFKDSLQTFHEKYSPQGGGLLDTCEISYNDIGNIRASNLPVYPNPAEGRIDFDIDEPEAFDIVIYNTQAQPVFEKQGCKLPIDVSALKPGLYFLKCYTGKKTVMGKFVKL